MALHVWAAQAAASQWGPGGNARTIFSEMNMTETVRQQTYDLIRDWRYAPPIHVVDGVGALPFPAPEDAHGAYFRRSVYLVDRPELDVPLILGHEVIGHHAPRALLGSRWRTTMRAIALAVRAGDPRFQRLHWHVASAYADDNGQLGLSNIQVADEIVARLAELRIHPRTASVEIQRPGWKRMRAAWGHFRREWLHLDEPLTIDELEGLLDTGSALIRSGFTPWNPAWWWYKPRMPQSKPMGPKVPAKSLRESERMLTAVNQRDEDWAFLKLWGVLLLGLLSVGVLIYEAWDLLLAPFFR
jgi:hypothetical protein